MASTTTNLGLTKPAYTDDADVAVINANSDIIDAAYGSLSDQVANLTNNTVREYSYLTQDEIPTTTELKNAITAISGACTYVMTFKRSYNQEARSAMIYNAASQSYGAGILFTYYNSSWYKVKNSNQTVTITAF